MNPSAEPDVLRLFDAHLHLQDERLSILKEGPATENFLVYSKWEPKIIARINNGTHPDDWPAVAALEDETNLKAYGVHPWKVDCLPPDWETTLTKYLESGAVSVGEIGLDRWIEPRNETLQLDVFQRQLALAAKLNLPPSLHCLKSWGMLVDCLRGTSLPRGFLVHGFGGSKEVLYQLLDLGGYVSFSAYAADQSRHRMREAARACPRDRLLVETDAPDMVPPAEVCLYSLTDTIGRIHHPAEIQTAYQFLAELRGEKLDQFVGQIEENFRKLFL